MGIVFMNVKGCWSSALEYIVSGLPKVPWSSLPSYLQTGTTFTFFQLPGISSVFPDLLKIIYKGMWYHQKTESSLKQM